jgi:hypothetical protein
LTVAGIDGPQADTAGLRVGRIGETCRWLGWTRTGSIELPCAMVFEVGSELARIGRELRAGEGGER